MIKKKQTLLLCFGLCLHIAFGNVLSSVLRLNTFFHYEIDLMKILQEYITNLEAKIVFLNNRMSQMRVSAVSDMGDPLSALTLIRKMAREWPLLLQLASEKYAFPMNTSTWPSEEDLQDVLNGLERLQEVYRLSPRELVEAGESTTFSRGDYFEIGRVAYYKMHFHQAHSWFQRCLQLIPPDDQSWMRLHTLAYNYLSLIILGCHQNKTVTKPLELLNHLMSQNPTLGLNYVEPKLASDINLVLSQDCTRINEEFTNQTTMGNIISESDNDRVNKLCRGGGRLKKGLKCFYVHNNNPKLVLAPAKLEELHKKPSVVMVHEFVSEKDMYAMIEQFYLVMEEAKVLSDGYTVSSDARISTLGWVEDSFPVSARLSQKVQDFTGFKGENNQVAYYGPVGEFRLHYDSMDVNSAKLFGNRVASVLIYMNDVPRGGYTVFPDLDLSVVPRSGSALFWFNHLQNGSRDPLMRHSGCPVLTGYKWVINKWLWEENCSMKRSPSRRKFY